MLYVERNTGEWIDVYIDVRDKFCGRCDANCTPERKLYCIEQFLYITEMWELSCDNM